MEKITPFKKYENGKFIFSNSYSTSSCISSNITSKLRNLNECQMFFNKDNELLIELKSGKCKEVESDNTDRAGIIKDILFQDINIIGKNIKKQINSKKLSFMDDYFKVDNFYGRVYLVKNLDLNDIKESINILKSNETTISIHLKKIHSEKILNIIDEVEVSDEFKLSLPVVKENIKKSISEGDPLYLIDIEILLLTKSKEKLEQSSLELKSKGKNAGYQISELYYQQRNGLYNVLPYGKNFLCVDRTLSLSKICKIGGWDYETR